VDAGASRQTAKENREEGDVSATSGDIRRIIDRLVEERQSLRSAKAESAELHANREALAYWQAQLSRTLAREAVQSAA
jgi:hypothetical protein